MKKTLFSIFLVTFFLALAVSSSAAQSPRKEGLLNGLKVLMWRDPSAQKLTVRLRIHSGSAFDPLGKEGLMQMLVENLFPTAASREYFTDDLGGSLNIIANYDYIEMDATANPDALLSVLENFASAVTNTQIDKETTARLRDELLARVRSKQADPAYAADQLAASRLFGSFPYGRPQLGTEASLKKIDFADLLQAKERFLTADNATLAIAGNHDETLALRSIKRLFGAWLKADKKVPATFKQPDDPAAAVLTLDMSGADKTQVRLAIRGVARSDKDLGAALVYASIVGSRLKSQAAAARLDDVFVRQEPHMLPGSMVVGFTAVGKPDVASLVTKAMSDPIADAEFQAAKSAVASSWPTDPITFWLDADTYGIEKADTDMHRIDNVTIGDVRSFAARAQKRPVASVEVVPARANP